MLSRYLIWSHSIDVPVYISYENTSKSLPLYCCLLTVLHLHCWLPTSSQHTHHVHQAWPPTYTLWFFPDNPIFCRKKDVVRNKVPHEHSSDQNNDNRKPFGTTEKSPLEKNYTQDCLSLLPISSSLVPRPPPFLPYVCVCNNTWEQKTGEKQGRPPGSIHHMSGREVDIGGEGPIFK